jgi:uncharacterized protein
MKKILYLHGLESQQGGEKVDFLSSRGSVYAPEMDYEDPKLFNKLNKIMVEFNPDLIIGSSMGGYTADILGGLFTKPTILFNPALHSRTIQPNYYGIKVKRILPSIVVLGSEDPIIDPTITKRMLEDYDTIIDIEGMGHRIPLEIFVDTYNKYVE